MVHKGLQICQGLSTNGDATAIQLFGMLLPWQPHQVAAYVFVMGAKDISKLVLIIRFYRAVAYFLLKAAADNGNHNSQLGDLQLARVITTDNVALLVVLVARVAVAQVFATAKRNVDLVAEQTPFVDSV